MSRQGLIVAKQYSVELPIFDSLAMAEKNLYELRDVGLSELQCVAELNGQLDYSPESLNSLEHWYFISGHQNTINSGYSLQHAIGFYFGEILCRHAGFNWVVQEFSYAKGRYEIGVQRQLLSIMLTNGKRPQVSSNKRMQSLWRNFKQYAP